MHNGPFTHGENGYQTKTLIMQSSSPVVPLTEVVHIHVQVQSVSREKGRHTKTNPDGIEGAPHRDIMGAGHRIMFCNIYCVKKKN